MKVRIVYTIDRDDPREIAPQRVLEIANLLGNQCRPDDFDQYVPQRDERYHRDSRDLFDILVGPIKGNSFGDADIRAFSRYARVVIDRVRETADAAASGKSGMVFATPRAEQAFASGIVASADLAERLLNEYLAAFEEAKASGMSDI